MSSKRYLIIQTSFIGDVILATSAVESIAKADRTAKIDFLLRKGNENLLANNPNVNEVIVWNKKQNKYKNLWKVIKQIRSNHYDEVINLQRFMATGMVTAFSGSKFKIGFKKNPLAFLFSTAVTHDIESGLHETERNFKLIEHIDGTKLEKPKIYPGANEKNTVASVVNDNYICMAPTSVWFTKQLPEDQWVKLSESIAKETTIYLLGAASDATACQNIIEKSSHPKIKNLAGKLSLLESAALISTAKMNYVNDSAPMHLASATNAPVTVFFCSTVPQFGFGPLSDQSKIVEIKEELNCRPCGLHGKKECPLGHFKCGYDIDVSGIQP